MTTAPPVSSDRSTAMTRARTNHRPGSAGTTEQRADVLTESQPGTAASTTPAEPARSLQPCGTPAAATRHHRRGEPLDAACRDAFRRYHREYRQAARNVEAFRRREIAARTRWEHRVSSDPARHERRLQRRRESARNRAAEERRSYVDVVAIERLLDGDRTVHLPHAEKRAAFDYLRAAGHTVTTASRVLRLSGATVRDYEASRLRCDLEETG